MSEVTVTSRLTTLGVLMSRLPVFVMMFLLPCQDLPQIGVPQFAVEPAGQYSYSSCQSYAIAAALAFKRDKNWPINSAHQLRLAERNLRKRITDKAPKGSSGKPDVKHLHVIEAFSDYTGGAYVIKQEYYRDTPALDDAIAQRTGVTDAIVVGNTFLLGAVVKDVLVASVIRIGDKSYPQGHLVTFLGVDGPPNSQRRYLVLNSAVNLAGKSVPTCREGIPDDPGPYRGLVSWVPSKDITFKRDVNGILSWRVEAK